MRKSVAAAAMAASLTLGGATGVALFAPELSSAAQTDGDTATTDAAHAEPGDRLAEVLAPLVEDGTITRVQADAVIDALVAARPDGARHGHRGPGGFLRGGAAQVADVLGLTAGELRAQLAQGNSLAEVAAALGVDVQEVIDVLVNAADERIDQALEDGRIDEDQAAERRSMVRDRVDDLVNRTFEPGRGRGH